MASINVADIRNIAFCGNGNAGKTMLADKILTSTGAINPAYAAYYANPNIFFGNAPAVIGNARVLPFLSENISLLKKTRLTETTTLEVGAEAFNIFNRHRFDFPGSDLIDPFNFGFSSVGTAQEPRVIQIRLRLTY